VLEATATDLPTEWPTMSPTQTPSQTPSKEPSHEPSQDISQEPSQDTSQEPSPLHSVQPSSSPSGRDTPIPLGSEPPKLMVPGGQGPGTIESFLPNPPPVNPPTGYFRYDARRRSEGGTGFGPGMKWEISNDGSSDFTNFTYVNNQWKKINGNHTAETKYWKEFREYLPQNLGENQCGETNGKQSPIDLVVSEGAECHEFHEIRHRPGDFRLDDPEVETLILPSKLRIQFPRRIGKEPDVPSADIPFGWQKQMDVLHIDIKIPSEHTVNGKRFAAEYQMFLLSTKTDRGIPAISILMDLHPEDEENSSFQKAIDEFQKVFINDLLLCKEKIERLKTQQLQGRTFEKERNTMKSSALIDLVDKLIAEEDDEVDSQKRRLADPKTSKGRWDPFHQGDILRSIWFYGYKGSLTEPPCTQLVHWRVIDEPMLISSTQLMHMKRLLFDHIDADCVPTSVQWEGSVARPIQQSTTTPVWKCSCKNFLSDDDREALGVSTC